MKALINSCRHSLKRHVLLFSFQIMLAVLQLLLLRLCNLFVAIWTSAALLTISFLNFPLFDIRFSVSIFNMFIRKYWATEWTDSARLNWSDARFKPKQQKQKIKRDYFRCDVIVVCFCMCEILCNIYVRSVVRQNV